MTLVLHPLTQQAIDLLIARPPQALLIAAPAGSGKDSVALEIIARFLRIDVAQLVNHPYVKRIMPNDKRRIGVDAARELAQFLSLRPPIQAIVNRIVMISQAETLTTQAQNALLKTLEEPPEATVIILTASDTTRLLPTILSRVQQLPLIPPHIPDLESYFIANDYVPSAIKKALLMSGGLPGLTQALLSDDASHPLVAAAERARQLLKQTVFDRLASSDDLAKDKQAWHDLLDMLSRMAAIAFQNPQLPSASAEQWRRILRACYDARQATLTSGQLKLITLNFLLSL